MNETIHGWLVRYFSRFLIPAKPISLTGRFFYAPSRPAEHNPNLAQSRHLLNSFVPISWLEFLGPNDTQLAAAESLRPDSNLLKILKDFQE